MPAATHWMASAIAIYSCARPCGSPSWVNQRATFRAIWSISVGDGVKKVALCRLLAEVTVSSCYRIRSTCSENRSAMLHISLFRQLMQGIHQGTVALAR